MFNKNASKLHKIVGNLLLSRNSSFSQYNSVQEYPVQKVNPSYVNSSHRFDWVILDLKVVIEVHGVQHFSTQTFGASNEEAVDKLFIQRNRDLYKKEAAIQAGYTYIEIPYTDEGKLDEAYLWSLINNNQTDIPFLDKTKKKKSKNNKEVLNRAREYRKERYQYLKKEREQYAKQKID